MRRYRRAFAFFRFLLKPFFKRKYRFQYDDLSGIEGPYLLLANHNMEVDPILVGIAARKQLFFVASEHIMRKGFGTWFLMRYFHPIIHRKGKDGAKSVFSILKTLRNGNSVCLFAEGNRSFDGVTGPIAEATGKMARSAGVRVVTFRFEGGFLTQPRFSVKSRKGRVLGHLVHVYEPEELRAMSEAEVNRAIAADLREDAYEAQARERIAYRGKQLARGLESTLFRCPVCGRFGTLTSGDDTLRCECGMSAVYDVYGNLTVTPPESGSGVAVDGVASEAEGGIAGDRASTRVTNLRDWNREQREALRTAAREATPGEPIFSDPVTIREIGEDHAIASERRGVLRGYCDRICVEGENGAEILLRDLAVYSRNFIAAYNGEELRQYDIRGDESFNALAYFCLYTDANTTRKQDFPHEID